MNSFRQFAASLFGTEPKESVTHTEYGDFPYPYLLIKKFGRVFRQDDDMERHIQGIEGCARDLKISGSKYDIYARSLGRGTVLVIGIRNEDDYNKLLETIKLYRKDLTPDQRIAPKAAIRSDQNLHLPAPQVPALNT